MHIMSSRKRCVSHHNLLQENPSKRAKLLSKLWKAKEKVEEEIEEEGEEGEKKKSIAVGLASNKDSVRRNQKKAEAIPGKSEQEHIANWQCFPYNKKRGQKQVGLATLTVDLCMTYHTKANILQNSKELIDESESANWTQGFPVVEPRKTAAISISQNRIREKSVEQQSDGTVPTNFVTSVNSTSRQIQDRDTLSSTQKTGCEKGSISSAQATFLPPVGAHEFAVEIPQHHSLEKGQYIRYQSLSSTQGYSSNSYCQSSGLVDSTSLSGGSISGLDSIIPDSQSLPGSSSYIPTTSTSLGVTSSNWSGQDHPHTHTAQTVTQLGTESSDLHDSEGASFIDNTTSLSGTDSAQINISGGSISISQISSTLSGNFSPGADAYTHLSPIKSNLNSANTARAAIGHASFSVLEIPESNTQSSCISRSSDANDRKSIPQAVTPGSRFWESQVTESSSSIGKSLIISEQILFELAR